MIKSQNSPVDGLILFCLIIAVPVAFIPGIIAWWLMRRMPTWLSLLIATFLVALMCTLVTATGEGGVGVFPVALIVVFGLVYGIDNSGSSSTSSRVEIGAVVADLIVWVVLYLVSMGVVGLWRLIKKRKIQAGGNLP